MQKTIFKANESNCFRIVQLKDNNKRPFKSLYCDKGQHCIKMNFKLEVNLKKIFQRQNMNCDIRNIRTDSES